MCGLFGYYSRHLPIQENLLVRAAENLKHRGPDSENIWMSSDRKVALCHTRLAIVDLGNIAYPLTSDDQKIKAVVNGEFYGYKEIRQTLAKEDYAFKTNTDSEILLPLFQKKGIHCLQDLIGEFSFIVWDEQTDTLFAARDRFGAKPLYYMPLSDQLFISSESSVFFNIGLPKKWSEESLFEFSHFQLSQEKTLYKDIYQVPPGHYLVANKTGYRIYRYWDLNYPKLEDKELLYSPPIDQCVEEVRELLIKSVNDRLQADVPVGVYLSGGVDSSGLLGIATHLQGRAVNAFSICFDEAQYDEGHIARNTARQMNANFHPLLITEENIIEHFTSAVTKSATVIPNAAGVARFLLSRHVRNLGYKVVLSGEGADELFFGYKAMKLESIAWIDDNNAQAVPATLKAVDSMLGLTPRWFRTQAFFQATHRQLFHKRLLEAHKNYNPYLAFLNTLDLVGQIQNRQEDHQSSYLWFKSFFVNTMLNYIGDRAEMAHSIEARLPYLDHRLFDYLKKLPLDYFCKETDKYLLRQALKPYLTEEVYSRPKYMFQAPPLRLSNKSKLFEFYQDIIRENLKDLAFYDSSKVLQFLDKACYIEKTNIPALIDASVTISILASIAALQKEYSLIA